MRRWNVQICVNTLMGFQVLYLSFLMPMPNLSGLLEEAELMHVVAYLINANGTGRNFLVMMCAFMTSNKLTLLSNIHVKV